MINRLCFPPKLISVLCVIQVAAIVTGVLLTGVFLKVGDTVYGKEDNLYWIQRFGASAALLFVRHHGLVFLMLPLLWAGWAILRNRRDSRVIELEPAESWTGIGLTAVIVLFFAYVSLMAVHIATAQRGPMTNVVKEG